VDGRAAPCHGCGTRSGTAIRLRVRLQALNASGAGERERECDEAQYEGDERECGRERAAWEDDAIAVRGGEREVLRAMAQVRREHEGHGRAHPTQACSGARMPAMISGIDAVSRNWGWRPTRRASKATPPARSASEVRIHARKVRSLARLKRGSGSVPCR
jgi:hypothetical protein